MSAERFVMEGIGVSPGYAIGRAHLVDRRRIQIPKYHLPHDQVESELERLEAALAQSESQIQDVRDKLSDAGEEHGLILEAHQLMLRDEQLVHATREAIRADLINAEWALKKVIRSIKQLFDNIDDEYFRERRADVEFVGSRVLRNLLGTAQPNLSLVGPSAIVVAHDLSPADTAFLMRTAVLGFATDAGGKTSHTAIMARSLDLPAVVGLENISERVATGDMLILDGASGRIVVNPSPVELARYQRLQLEWQNRLAVITASRHAPAATTDGVPVHIAANVERPEETRTALEFGALGVGLYRTEYLYMNRETLPSEDEQYAAYRQVVEDAGPSGATIRTLDIGGDKFIEHLKRNRELNPVMGLRAIRFCLHELKLFKTQLRALLRASAHGRLRILIPLVSGVEEVRVVRALLQDCRDEVVAAGHAVADDIPLGIMIELPSAALIADVLAHEADFFAIGTNDLIQYMLAIDRGNEHVAHLYRPLHPAVLRVLAQVVAAAHAAGIPVSMCGEMAGEPGYIPVLLGLGLTELSMNTVSVPLVKSVVRAISMADCRALFSELSALVTTAEIERRVALRTQQLLKDLPLPELFSHAR
ncbi:MAG: phosphoenolpyruvate--protein phosphotransferase [Myxococcales bacterium]|nr:phosphoenolpyruvate--protein phosphotransferase [Myxococcales bacterium]MCB9548624.1 phosphoenolpyruvate--protein phosphotransferase [Myxococcales bacterium]